jgi:hypothetical protein
VLRLLDEVLARQALADALELDDGLREHFRVAEHGRGELDRRLLRAPIARVRLAPRGAGRGLRARAHLLGDVAALEPRRAGLRVHDLDDRREAAARGGRVRPALVDVATRERVAATHAHRAGLGGHVVLDVDRDDLADLGRGVPAEDPHRALAEAPLVEVQAVEVDVELEALACRELAQELGVGHPRLREERQHLARVLDVLELGAVAVLLGHLARDVRALLVLEGAAPRDLVHQHRLRVRLDRELLEAGHLLDHALARGRHLARVAPGDLEEVALLPDRIIEVREVPVVDGEDELVGLLLRVLEHEREHAVGQVDALVAAALWNDLHVEDRLGARADGHGVASPRRRSEKISSSTVRTDGMTSTRPGSRPTVGSWIGSGWKSAMTHHRPAGLGSGAK